MSALGFILAAYGAILGAVALYAATLLRRLRRARESMGSGEELAGPGAAAGAPVDGPE